MIIILTGMMIAEFLYTDYGGFGVAMIIMFYYFRKKTKPLIICLVLINLVYGALSLAYGYAPIQALAGAAAVPIYFYSGEKGRPAKYLFYIFYPGHLAALAAIAYIFNIGG